MSLGTGIFLSAVFLGIIALYLGTKDRWNWRTLARGLGISIAMVVVLSVVLWGGASLLDWQASRPQRPGRVDAFFGVELGMTREDVLFMKGQPAVHLDAQLIEQLLSPVTVDEAWRYGISGAEVWHYQVAYEEPIPTQLGQTRSRTRWYRVRFGPEGLALIACIDWCEGAQQLNGVAWGSSLELLEEKFGQPSSIEESEDHTRRLFVFDDYNLVLLLRLGSVIAYGIYDPAAGEPSLEELIRIIPSG